MNTKSLRHWLKTTQARRLFSLCRWLHIYTSTALFSLLVFFCFTGITLNHPDWASSEPESITTLNLPESVVSGLKMGEELPLKTVQSFIEQQTGLSDPRNIDVMLEDGEITYDYPLPAGYAFVTVFMEDGLAEVEHKRSDLIGLLNDLHKGRNTGEAWKWLIDVSAVLMLLFTFTGIFILLQNAKHRRASFWVLVMGSLSPVLFYFALVPRFTL